MSSIRAQHVEVLCLHYLADYEGIGITAGISFVFLFISVFTSTQKYALISFVSTTIIFRTKNYINTVTEFVPIKVNHRQFQTVFVISFKGKKPASNSHCFAQTNVCHSQFRTVTDICFAKWKCRKDSFRLWPTCLSFFRRKCTTVGLQTVTDCFVLQKTLHQ